MNSIAAQELLQYNFITGLICLIIGLIGFPLSCYYTYKMGKATWDRTLCMPNPLCMFMILPIMMFCLLLFNGGDKVLKVLIAPNTYLQEHMKD